MRFLVKLAVVGLALPLATVALAAPQATSGPLTWRASAQRPSPTFQTPERLAISPDRGRSPLWTPEGLYPRAPQRWRGLAKAEGAGAATYDPSTLAWYAAAVGTLVRVDADGRLPVVVQGVQGTDVDVRAAHGLAVSREPDDRIVLHRFGHGDTTHTTLLQGEAFLPRFSPDASRVVVSETRRGEGWLRVIDLTARTVAQTRGHGAVWHPDGRRIVFQRSSDDGERIVASDLWQLDVATRAEQRVTATPAIAEIEATLSPDGHWIAYTDALTGDLCVAAFPLGRK